MWKQGGAERNEWCQIAMRYPPYLVIGIFNVDLKERIIHLYHFFTTTNPLKRIKNEDAQNTTDGWHGIVRKITFKQLLKSYQTEIHLCCTFNFGVTVYVRSGSSHTPLHSEIENVIEILIFEFDLWRKYNELTKDKYPKLKNRYTLLWLENSFHDMKCLTKKNWLIFRNEIMEKREELMVLLNLKWIPKCTLGPLDRIISTEWLKPAARITPWM